MTVSLGGVTLQGITLNGSYTFLRSRDQQNGFSAGGGGFGGASTAGDPNLVQWGTSDLERGNRCSARSPFRRARGSTSRPSAG